MKPLRVKLTLAHDGGPLAVIDGLPGDGAELRPRQIRALALALGHLADDVDSRKATHRGRPLPDERRTYPLGD